MSVPPKSGLAPNCPSMTGVAWRCDKDVAGHRPPSVEILSEEESMHAYIHAYDHTHTHTHAHHRIFAQYGVVWDGGS